MSGVAVVGGGIVGLAAAWRCRQRGLDVTVYDDGGDRASDVAAGMLAADGEALPGEDALAGLMRASARLWPEFAAELTGAAGVHVGYRDEGTLLVAATGADLAEVRRLCARAGTGTPLTAAQLRDREPLLSPRVVGGAYLPGDRQVDPRRVLAALRRLVPVDRRRVADLAELDADVVVVAAGVGTRALTGLAVRPVKGQTVRLRAPQPPLRHVVRGWVRGRSVYLVPRAGGELVVGATEEERGADTTLTAGGLLDLLRPAADLLPAIGEYPVTEIVAGLRPGTPDNAPALGAWKDGVVVAAGHYRHGVLLAPVTAAVVADVVCTGRTAWDVSAFDPAREELCR